jgi:hypothetical protein
MSCGCKGQPRPVHRDEEAEWVQCEFVDTGILGGKYFPRRQIHPIVLAADETRKIGTLSDVTQTMYVTVLAGVLSLWFEDYWQGDITEQVHATFSTGNGPSEVILPPGEHRLVFFADDDAAVTATVCILDREAHRD